MTVEEEETPVAPLDWQKRLPQSYPEYVDFLPVEGRGIGMFVLRDFQPGETVLCEKPFFTRPRPDEVAKRDDFTNEWGEAFDKIKAPLRYPGGSETEVKLRASAGMVRSALGFAASGPRVRRELLKLWHPPLDSEHPLVEIARQLAALCIEHLSDCKGLVHSELQAGILAIEMNMFVGGRVFQLFSRANHSCFPNAVFIHGKDDWRLQALRPIQRGEELVHSYLGEQLLLPAEQRRWHLWRSKCFRCICERCVARVDPLRAVPCRLCAAEVSTMSAKQWLVVNDPVVWRRDSPSTEGIKLGFIRCKATFATTGNFSGKWVELATPPGGWVLTDGKDLGLGALCTPVLEEVDIWGAYRLIFFRSREYPAPSVAVDYPVADIIKLWLPAHCVNNPRAADVEYAQFEAGHWHCPKCGRDDDNATLLEVERYLGRLAERTFYSRDIVKRAGVVNVGTDQTHISMIEEGFLVNALHLAEVVAHVLGHKHWTTQWARILFTDIAGSLEEFSCHTSFFHKETYRDLCLLWEWLESLRLAQGPSCWLHRRAERFLGAKHTAPRAGSEDCEWFDELARRHSGAAPAVNMLPLRNYVLECSVTFG